MRIKPKWYESPKTVDGTLCITSSISQASGKKKMASISFALKKWFGCSESRNRSGFSSSGEFVVSVKS
jgi:hypothetical protein